MKHPVLTALRRTVLAAAVGSLLLAPGFAAERGGAANLAMVGEPPTLDPMASAADLVGTLMQHVYEPLYTFDAQWNLAPMLAERLPEVSADGLVYTIPLRKGVKFHNGREMNADDVVASLKRWADLAPRGKATAKEVKSIEARDPATVVVTLNRPYAPLVAQFALPTGFAAIMPKETIANPLTEFVGTGPYRLKERKPDQYVLMTRFDEYTPRADAASGYAGKREALLDELRFVPVPNANTRVEGSLSGQYQFADLLPVESKKRLDNQPKIKPLLTKPFGFPYLVLNTRQGVLANAALRQAVQTAVNPTEMLLAGFGDPQFFEATGAHFPAGSAFHSDAGTARYGVADAAKAKTEAAAAKYDGAPVRILASQQYEFHYRIALVLAENLKAAGFKVDLQLVDWATLVQRRNDPALWDVYVTHSAFLPEPMLSPPQLGDDAPGWWKTPAKDAALTAFNGETDPARRGALWAKVQETVYDEVPYIRVGNFNALTAVSPRLEGYDPRPWPYFWNVGLKQK